MTGQERSPARITHCLAAPESTSPRSSWRVWRPRHSFSCLSGRLLTDRRPLRGSRQQNRQSSPRSRLWPCSRRSTRHLPLQRRGGALRSAPRARRGPHLSSFKCGQKRSRHNPGSLDSCWETAANRCGRFRSRVADRSADRRRLARSDGRECGAAVRTRRAAIDRARGVSGASRTPWRAAAPAASHRRSRQAE